MTSKVAYSIAPIVRRETRSEVVWVEAKHVTAV
jgi:hypothetical protein